MKVVATVPYPNSEETLIGNPFAMEHLYNVPATMDGRQVGVCNNITIDRGVDGEITFIVDIDLFSNVKVDISRL